jgi:hypothetical protein
LIKATEFGWSKAIAARGQLGLIKTKNSCNIVAVTAYNSGAEEKALKHKIDRVCQKPIGVQVIEEILKLYFWPK